MIAIRSLAKKLRQAADVLDDLFRDGAQVRPRGSYKKKKTPSNETPAVAAQIRRGFKRKRKTRRAYAAGEHWTQKPENKARVMRAVRRANRASWTKKRKEKAS